MIVYTCNNEIKQKLLDNKQVLVKEVETEGKKVYLFKINNLSIINSFSDNEKSLIFCNNKMTF